jgi:hypothetical protein
MDIFFRDPSEIPLPPEEVRIRVLQADPYPDGQRVRIHLEVDPFQRRPNADVRITNDQGYELANTSIIESMVRKMEFTMHLRPPNPATPCVVSVALFYSKTAEANDASAAEVSKPEILIVDRAEVQFEMRDR